MRPDGDPERDDYGLPHVDVVVPDDARELERDLLAYRREERQRRRRERIRRLLRPITRLGPAVPIITAALLIAIVSGALITVLGPTPNNTSRQSTTPSSSAPTAAPVRRPGEVGGPLPQGLTIRLDGKDVPITDLQGAVIMLVPQGCQCAQAVQGIAQQARQSDVNAVLVGSHPWTATTGADLARLGAGKVRTAQDESGALTRTYQATGLTAILVHIDGIVTDIRRNIPDTGVQLPADELKGLTGPGAVLAPNTTPGH